MKPFDSFIYQNGKGASLQWGESHVYLARTIREGGKTVVRTTSMPIPPEWRNASGPKLAAWQKPWIKGPSKPKARTKHLPPVLWQEGTTVHASGALIVRKREHGGTKESFTVKFPDVDAAQAYSVFVVRSLFAHLLLTLPRPIARRLSNPAEKRAILESAAMVHGGRLSVAIAAWIREAQAMEQADSKESQQRQRKARKEKHKARKAQERATA